MGPGMSCAELHCFCDASVVGYGAVCYLRVVVDGVTFCSLVMGKSRVTPIKTVSIPRLELSAATVGVKLGKLVAGELTCKLHRIVYWTDSTSVLQFLNNPGRRFQTFVANRLAIINDLSHTKQWRYVDTKNNPADLASRGLMPNQIEKARLWFEGPPFLLKNEDEWPRQLVNFPSRPDEEIEFKPTFKVNTVVGTILPVCLKRLICHYSTWVRLLRAVAWLTRYKQYLRGNIPKTTRLMGDQQATDRILMVDELRQSGFDVVKLVQWEMFPEIVNGLEDRSSCREALRYKAIKCIKSPSLSLQRLQPILVNGILRVGGRLLEAGLEEDSRHPMILPSHHHVTDLIIQYYHVKAGHCGTQYVLGLVREMYWIVHGHSAVRRYLKECRPCRRWKAKVGEQVMAPLPKCRVVAGNAPFTATGVDYMGPLLVKVGRSHVQRYACVFTCMATRAVHLEVAISLETSAFLNALSRFLHRRGSTANCRMIRCILFWSK
uniref:uncharacterized protein LOC101242224 n=1 Tax=Ciona intestinalis TaxID=7719 RepID=UPI000EF51403|nr:uncharacterized protein LOC101242224 [Ciona intestinalis]|eukprot:XP_026695063.1 uncharacterized protein LOC101242224 [Ciona intestinalis]